MERTNAVALGLIALGSVTLGTLAGPAPDAVAETTPNTRMLRNPDVSATHITFVYANDLWIVPREGGTALPLASPPGRESTPRFSPDGGTIAFMGNYDGNVDLYTIPITGGVPHRVTYHPSTERLCDWTGADELIFSASGREGLRRQSKLFRIAATGGPATTLPLPYGANAATSPDGNWLAYTPHSRDHRTWKRYRGGQATDVWLFHLEKHTAERITDWEGTDSQPMWHGEKLYYVSDAGPAHRINIWVYDTASGERRQITKYRDFDVKWPAIGPDAMVFEVGGSLKLLDLATGETSDVHVSVPGDRTLLRPRTVTASKHVQSWNLSSTGKRAVFAARGDVWTVPVKSGSPRQITRTPGVAERDPSWSPDGRWIAYFSDATGEYELHVTQSDGREETRQLTNDGAVFRSTPTWSPDSKHIAFTDKTGKIHLHTIESGRTVLVDTHPWSEGPRLRWAPDSGWITYERPGEKGREAIWLYDVRKGETHRVTSGMFPDTSPVFGSEGKFLYYASNREFSRPIYEDNGSTFVYGDTTVLLAVPLRSDISSPYAPESDEESWDDGDDSDSETDADDADGSAESDDAGDDGDDGDRPDKGEGDGKKNKKKKKTVEPILIDLEGFERRGVRLKVKRGRLGRLEVTSDGKLLYSRGGRRGRGAGDKPRIEVFDPTKRKGKPKTVVAGAADFRMSGNAKKLLVRKGSDYSVVDAEADQKLDKTLDLSGMTTVSEPAAEWPQIFHDAWRIHRDFFYDPNMHGVDWAAVRDRYRPMIDDCVSREDVSFVIREMISELNVGHAYYWGGDGEETPSVSVGMLGVDFALDGAAFRIAKIHEGAPWDDDGRGPLSAPGVDVAEGDFLLAVGGVPLDVDKEPWAAFQGMAGKVVTLTVGKKPTMDDDARQVVVKLLGSETSLRYRSWVEGKRAYVEKTTDGKVGYIHVPDTGVHGQNELFRQFIGQTDRDALVIDERWNGGGQIPTRFIELLNRPVTNYWARRDGVDWTWPHDAHHGPKCMLVNGLAGSGGDAFPAYFRRAGLGPLIGTRTWGGLVGISGNPGLVDGGYTSVPTFAYYETDGTWGIEGHGVDPDIEVIDDPSLMTNGGDPQLDRAIAEMLRAIQDRPYTPPNRPAYPDRSGMGITDRDK